MYIYTFVVLFARKTKVLVDIESCYKLKSGMRQSSSFENIEVEIASKTSIMVNGGREQPDTQDIEMSQN